MSFEKSGCVQLTREEYQLLCSVVGHQATPLIKASAAMDKLGLNYDSAKALLDSGEYRIVED